MRHAEAGTSTLDKNRPLTDAGHRQAKQAAAILNQVGWQPDEILVSTALRTQETCQDVVAGLKTTPRVTSEHRLYNYAGPSVGKHGDLLWDFFKSVIATARPESRTLMILAHNPEMSEMAGYLSGELPPDLQTGYPSATACLLQTTAAQWGQMHPGNTSLSKAIVSGTKLIDLQPQ